MSAEYQLKRAVQSIESVATALRRTLPGVDASASYTLRRALSDLEEAERYVKKAIRELP